MTIMGAHRRRLSSRRSVALGLVLGLAFAGAASPAASECSAGPLSIRSATPPATPYNCKRNCTADRGSLKIGEVSFTKPYADLGGTTVPLCLSACTQTAGCMAVSYSIQVTNISGKLETTIRCSLWRDAELASRDQPAQLVANARKASTPSGMTAAGVCTRDNSPVPFNDIPQPLDARLQQDQFRPGQPPAPPPPSSYNNIR